MSAYTGTSRLLWLAVRRDRVLLPVWILGLAGVSASSVRTTAALYDTPETIRSAAHAVNSTPALVAMYGPIADESSVGAVSVFKLVLFGGLFVGFLTALIVRRHTRVDEESGRAELLGAGVIGRRAILTAALLEAVAAALLVGVVTAVGNTASGLDAKGSWAFGLGWAGLGLVAAAVAAVAAQLSSSARTGAGMVALVLGAVYVVRAVGDVSQGWLTWLSPFGWLTQLRPYAGDRWWVLVLPMLVSLAGFALAMVLRDRRDLGGGLIAARAGAVHGPAWLANVAALHWRLGRTSLLLWATAMLVIGSLLGGIAPGVDSFVDSPAARRMLERLGGAGIIQDTFLAAEISIMAAIVAAYAIGIVTRSASEETDGRSEITLTTGATRAETFAVTTVLAILGSGVLAVTFAVGTGIFFGLQEGGVGHTVGRLVPAVLAQLPAVWVVLALAMATWAWWPRAMYLAWGVLVAFLVTGQLGELLGLPGWVIDLSPFGHVPRMPVESFAWSPELGLTAVGLGFLGAAWWRYRERNIG